MSPANAGAVKVLTFSPYFFISLCVGLSRFMQNHFSFFELSPAFDIDLADLTYRYRELQKVIHPDKFANSPESERLKAVQRAAQINDAFDVLKSPLLRAQHLLVLNGIEPEKNATISDPMFLMQQMEMRESLEEAAAKDDALSAIEEAIDGIDDVYRELLGKIKTLFAESSPDYKNINDLVLKLHFFNRLKREAEALLAKIEDS